MDNFNDLLNIEPTIMIQAFNPEYYQSGMAVRVWEKGEYFYNAIIQSVSHKEIIVATVKDGEIVSESISIGEVIMKMVKIDIIKN